MCQMCQESIQHLFLECKVAHIVWNSCHSWLEIQSLLHNNLFVHFEQFQLLHLNKNQNQVWKTMWIAMIWSIWNQRNTMVFKYGVVDVEEVIIWLI